MTEDELIKNTAKEGIFPYLIVGIISVMFILTVFQSYQIALLFSEVKNIRLSEANNKSTDTTSNLANIDVIPKGVPAIYGSELGISFDDVSPTNQQKANETIAKLGAFDKQIQLEGDLLQRYINIAGSISCEYCCGAEALIFTRDTGNYKAGDAACGCAHSYAMRGLAKYLLKNHPKEFTDDQILSELGKWKTLFFPDIMTAKAAVLKEKGIELNYINLASNKYRGIEKGASNSKMVGGC